jgi:HK97 family phage prohead protease
MKQRSQRPVILSAPEWRAQYKKGTVAAIARSLTIERNSDGSYSFTASSADPDRYGDTIDQQGWQLANYKANPVILWAHSHYTPPVGKAPATALNAAGNLSTGPITFTSEAENPFGHQVGLMVAGGFLNTVSVGFLPLEWEERYDEKGYFLGYHFKRMELLEISIVPVPANPQALIEGKAAPVFVKSLTEWMASDADQDVPLARTFRNELAGYLKAAEDLQTAAEDEADQGAFTRMEQLLERIAKATEAPRFTVKMGDGMEVSGSDWEGVVKLCETLKVKAKALPQKPAEPAPVVSESRSVEDGSDPVLGWISGG